MPWWPVPQLHAEQRETRKMVLSFIWSYLCQGSAPHWMLLLKTARTSTSQLDSQVILKNLRVTFMFCWACPLNCHMASDTFLSFLLNSHIRWFIDVTHEATSFWRAWYWRTVQLLQRSHSAKDQHTCWCLTPTHAHTTTFLWSALVTVTFQECCCVFALPVYILYFA